MTRHVTIMSAGTRVLFHNHVPEGVAEGVVLLTKDKGHAATVIWVVQGYLEVKYSKGLSLALLVPRL